jgi:hypothetical protein
MLIVISDRKIESTTTAYACSFFLTGPLNRKTNNIIINCIDAVLSACLSDGLVIIFSKEGE